MSMYIHNNDIHNESTWPRPKSPDLQWKDGRSAKELAKYITESLPAMPIEIEECIKSCANISNSDFSFDAEVLTSFPGKQYGIGGGRNHDAIIYNDQIFVGIEAKADEQLDKTIEKWLGKGSNNRKKRAQALSEMIFGDGYENHMCIRYQLMTALAGVLLEAQRREISTAVLLMLVFKKEGLDKDGKPYYSEKKVKRNEDDIRKFMMELQVNADTGQVMTYFGRKNRIDTFVKEINICV